MQRNWADDEAGRLSVNGCWIEESWMVFIPPDIREDPIFHPGDLFDSLRNSLSRSKISKGMVFPFPIDVTQGLDWKSGRKIKPFWWFIIIWSTLEISMLILGYTPFSDTTMFKIIHGKIPICTRYLIVNPIFSSQLFMAHSQFSLLNSHFWWLFPNYADCLS